MSLAHSASIAAQPTGAATLSVEGSAEGRRGEAHKTDGDFGGVMSRTHRKVSVKALAAIEEPLAIPLLPGASSSAPPLLTIESGETPHESDQRPLPTLNDRLVGVAGPADLRPAAQTVGLRESLPTSGPVPTTVNPSEIGEIYLAQNLNRMLEEGLHHAVIRVSPGELGDIEIQLTVRHDTVSIDFGAPVAQTRALLEQAVPRLAELMAQGGLSVAHVGVSSALVRDGWVALRPLAMTERPARTELVSSEPKTPGRATRRRLVDLYA